MCSWVQFTGGYRSDSQMTIRQMHCRLRGSVGHTPICNVPYVTYPLYPKLHVAPMNPHGTVGPSGLCCFSLISAFVMLALLALLLPTDRIAKKAFFPRSVGRPPRHTLPPLPSLVGSPSPRPTTTTSFCTMSALAETTNATLATEPKTKARRVPCLKPLPAVAPCPRPTLPSARYPPRAPARQPKCAIL